MGPNVVPIMDAPRALARIRQLASDTGNIVQGPEAPSRMRKRRISWAEIVKVLQLGQITEGPFVDQKGCWRCRLERFAAGESVKVAVSICDDVLVVITCF